MTVILSNYSTGLEADLFYVHEGAVNTYAMQFTVPVQADVYDLEFSWQSLTTHPVSIHIHSILTPFETTCYETERVKCVIHSPQTTELNIKFFL